MQIHSQSAIGFAWYTPRQQLIVSAVHRFCKSKDFFGASIHQYLLANRNHLKRHSKFLLSKTALPSNPSRKTAVPSIRSSVQRKQQLRKATKSQAP
jgi:hypothetical protein